MRKALVTITVIALVISIIGTGIIVYIETTAPTASTVSSEISQ